MVRTNLPISDQFYFEIVVMSSPQDAPLSLALGAVSGDQSGWKAENIRFVEYAVSNLHEDPVIGVLYDTSNLTIKIFRGGKLVSTDRLSDGTQKPEVCTVYISYRRTAGMLIVFCCRVPSSLPYLAHLLAQL